MGRKVATQRDIPMQSLKEFKEKTAAKASPRPKDKNLGKLKVRVNHPWRTDLSEVTNAVWSIGSIAGSELLI